MQYEPETLGLATVATRRIDDATIVAEQKRKKRHRRTALSTFFDDASVFELVAKRS